MRSYPTNVIIYSKDNLVNQHRKIAFLGKDLRNSSENQEVCSVVWQHCGKGAGAFWTNTNYDKKDGITKLCLDDFIDICNYNGLSFTYDERFKQIILYKVLEDISMEIECVITETEKGITIDWIYSAFAYIDYPAEYVEINPASTDSHIITVLDILQIKKIFDFNKI